jgi:hypothetical protein
VVEPLKEIVVADPVSLRAEMLASDEPFVMRGLVAAWPAVAAAQRSPGDAATYLAGFDRGAPVEMFVGPAAMEGRYFYRDDMSGFNFERRRARVSDVLRYLAGSAAGGAEHSIYVGSTPADEILPDFAARHPMPLVDPNVAPPRVWIGNRISTWARLTSPWLGSPRAWCRCSSRT